MHCERSMDFTINCDLGEGFGRYRVADDAEIMPLIDLANIACGFHASDPIIMSDTARLAAAAGKRAGAHPSLPDLQGFGRREMMLTRYEVSCAVRYQIGAIKAFLDAENIPLSHVKPHGALYGMAARDENIANAICDGAEGFDVPILGLAGTAHEHVYTKRGFDFVAEFYADLDYDDAGMIVIGRRPQTRAATAAADRVVQALCHGVTLSANGLSIPVRATSVCVHSDSGNALELIRAIRNVLSTLGAIQ
jgi:5-oxoprolinase (ATP-hydrolysing) subunit A